MPLCITKYCSSTSLLGATPVLFRVRQSITPVLRTILYYKGLLQYYSVLQSAAPVVLFKYYSLLQSITPVLLCTRKYYSSATLYYKILLQYCCVLQSAPPVLLCTTQVLPCTTKYCSSTAKSYSNYSLPQTLTPGLLCGTKCHSSTTLYYKVLLLLPSTTKCYSSANKWLTTYGEWLRIWLLQYYSVVLLQ